ncbi:hypothetical protein BJ165DRAFT_1521399 [Panaeolus papilionaceus]|nr:hypothetical protein BJ165DRAFT_1521399 [Panaeolus papilionaceus]
MSRHTRARAIPTTTPKPVILPLPTAMVASLLARTVLRQRVAVNARSFHASGPARSAHDHYHHLPFAFPGQKKAAFAAKLTFFLVSGFSIPIAASVWQLKKSGGSD